MREWETHHKNVSLGIYSGFMSRIVYFGKTSNSKATAWCIYNWPIIFCDKSTGNRCWGLLRDAKPANTEILATWGLRDLKVLNECGTPMVVVDEHSGHMLWQNASHMALVGMHSASNNDGASSSSNDPSKEGHNYLEMLFHGAPDAPRHVIAYTHQLGTAVSDQRAPITHPLLRTWLGLKSKEEMWISIRISLARDPSTSLPIYIISHVDVTERVRGEESLKKALQDLELEKKRTESLLQRQYELLECLGKVTTAQTGIDKDSAAARMLEGVKRKMMVGASSTRAINALSSEQQYETEEKLEILELIGTGSFGNVFKGVWNGSLVAVKVMLLSPDGQERQERMALMEAAISSSLHHENIVQTYTYNLKTVKSSETSSDPLTDDTQEGGGSSSSAVPAIKHISLQVQLVLEWCDFGTLRDALNQKVFFDPKTFVLNLGAVLLTAVDVVRGMIHLHKSGLVHSDLKARNILLKSTPSPPVTDPRGFVAKISDFGLSLSLDTGKTHVEDLYQGTTTHMAPEILLRGRQSKAGDVYAFGIVLWELFTGGNPFAHIPVTSLGFQVVKQDLRPEFLPNTPPAYVLLANRCWSPYPETRPGFEEILESLERMVAEYPCSNSCTIPFLPVRMKSQVTLDKLEDLPGFSRNPGHTYDARQAISLRRAPSTRNPGSAFVCAPMDEDSELQSEHDVRNRIDMAKLFSSLPGGTPAGRKTMQDFITETGIVCQDAGSTVMDRPDLLSEYLE